MNLSNIKDTLTTIAGILGVIAATIVGVQSQGIAVPPIILAIGGVCGALSLGILGYFNGKNPNGTVKSQAQISELNTKALE